MMVAPTFGALSTAGPYISLDDLHARNQQKLARCDARRQVEAQLNSTKVEEADGGGEGDGWVWCAGPGPTVSTV